MKKSFFILSLMTETVLYPCYAWADIASGICGQTAADCSFVVNNSGLLTISGTGNHWPFGEQWRPKSYTSSITQVVIEEGVKTLLSNSFLDMSQLTGSLVIPTSMTTIGFNAFKGTRFTNITIPDSVSSIGTDAFYDVTPQELTISASKLQKYLEANGGFASNANITCTSGDCTSTLTQWDAVHGTHYASNVTITIPSASTTQQGSATGGGTGGADSGTNSGKRIYTVEEARQAVEAAGTDTVNVRIRYK